MASHYFICASPRSGSTLLGQGLQDTFKAGRPVEYFNRGYVGSFLQRPGATIFRYVKAVKRAGSTDNGVFGAKVHWYQLSEFGLYFSAVPRWNQLSLPQLMFNLFPDARYIWLKRSDQLRQAISLYKALRLNIWWKITRNQRNKSDIQLPFSHALAREQVRAAHFGDGNFGFKVLNQEGSSTELSTVGCDCRAIDCRVIDRLEKVLAAQETSWQNFFDESGVQPLVLTYEELSASYKHTIISVMDYLGIPTSQDIVIGAPRLAKQSNSNSEELVQQCLAYRQGVQLSAAETLPVSSRRKMALVVPK
jgi:LPS sulfotransferase NodH